MKIDEEIKSFIEVKRQLKLLEGIKEQLEKVIIPYMKKRKLEEVEKEGGKVLLRSRTTRVLDSTKVFEKVDMDISTFLEVASVKITDAKKHLGEKDINDCVSKSDTVEYLETKLNDIEAKEEVVLSVNERIKNFEYIY